MKHLTFPSNFNNSKLFFSKNELSKIFSCYSIGVSKGKWKDYAINFQKNEANFFMFKHTLSLPDCILTKTIKNKKKLTTFKLILNSNNKKKYNKIDDLLAAILRKQFKLI